MISPLRSWKEKFGSPARSFPKRWSGRVCPAVEGLEDRTLPAVVTIVAIQNGAEGGANGLFRGEEKRRKGDADIFTLAARGVGSVVVVA
jgi:hypothetical protein